MGGAPAEAACTVLMDAISDEDSSVDTQVGREVGRRAGREAELFQHIDCMCIRINRWGQNGGSTLVSQKVIY